MSRELDKAIAEALGYEVGNTMNTLNKEWWQECPMCGYDGYWDANSIPYFSSDGNAMLELDREMRGRGYELCLWCVDGEWDTAYMVVEQRKLEIPIPGRNSVMGIDTEPLARALAAYKALTGKEWVD